MFKIGEFARLAGVSTKTLRLYDSLGLLRPAQVDVASGYRLYLANQLPALNRILVLKELGLSLEQIARAVEAGIGPAEIRGMLRLRLAESEQVIAREQQRLARIEAHLRQLEQDDQPPLLDVVVRAVPAQPVAAISATLTGDETPWPLVGAVRRFIHRHHLRAAAPVTLVYHACDDDQETLEVALPLAARPALQAVAPAAPVVLDELPAVARMACIVHQGPYETLCLTGQTFGRWLEQHRHQADGPTREVWLSPALEDGSPPHGLCVIELQFPLAAGVNDVALR